MKNKKKLLVSIAAVVLAGVLLAGSATFSYLKDSTDTITNEFNTNKVTLEISEDSGREYEIIPGVPQEKNPMVTADVTVPSYIFVEIDDNTLAADGTTKLVEYAIESGWTDLGISTSSHKVYYRTVEGYYDRDEEKWYTDETKATELEVEFYILKDNQVTYDASLVNDDMLDGSDLKDDVYLSFKATAIQMEPFADALSAYYEDPNGAKLITDISEFPMVMDDYKKTLVLEDGINEIPAFMTKGDTELTLDLNGNEVFITTPAVGSTGTESQGMHLEEDCTVTIKNGTVRISPNHNGPVIQILVQNYCNLTLEDVTLDGRTNGEDNYVTVSINAGTVTLKGNTNIIGPTPSRYNYYYDVALDIMNWGDYPDSDSICIIDESMTGTIDGSVDIYNYPDTYSPTDHIGALFASGGTFIGSGLSASSTNTDGSSWIADGYTLRTNSDGSFTVVAE